MEKDYLNKSECNPEEELNNKEQHDSTNKFRVRKKQMYIKLLNQMQFYFSCSNISRDRFMSKLLAEDPYIPLATFLNFNKIATIFKNYMIIPEEKQLHELAKSINKSETLELSEDRTKIRLKVDIPKKSQEEIDECTIYVEQIPLNSTHDSLKAIFEKYGKINYISLPRYKKSRQIKQFCFIEFDDKTSVQNVLSGFKKIDGILQHTTLKPESLLSIATFEKNDENDDQPPPAKKMKIDKEEEVENKDQLNAESSVNVDNKKDVKTEDVEEKSMDEEKPDTTEQLEDAPKKKKRKHKRRNTAKNKCLDEHVMAMKIMKKNEWKKLRNSYLNLERQKAKEIKKILRESYNKRNDKSQSYSVLQTNKASPKISFYGSPNDRSTETPSEPLTESILESGNLIFTPDCIVNIKFREPCIDFKEFKKEIKQFPSVQYVDIMEGGSQCFIRVSNSQSAHELVRHYSSCEYETEILKDELEKDYWKKIFDNRENKKKNVDKTKPVEKKRHRRRGREKLIDKITKITQNQIIRFTDDHGD